MPRVPTRTTSPSTVVGGAIAGVPATIVMTAVMEGAQRAGLLGKYPPRRISEVALRAAGAEPTSEATRRLLTAATHLGFGAAAGAAFAALHGRVGDRVPTVLQGMAFGVAVWAVSYKGWIPALRLLPPPERDRPGRPTSMIAAHLVYGAVLAAVVGRLEGPQE